MGAGKTAIGRELARLLNLDFVDADHELERRTGADIPLIFAKEGEAGFRKRERELLEELTQHDRLVLATGGGAVLDPANRAALARGFVVYLKATVAVQAARTGKNRNRPLLQSADPVARLEELYAVRAPLYEGLAQLAVDTESGQVRRIAERIVEALGNPQD